MKYIVKKGDSLIKILRNYGLVQSGMLNEVIKRNKLKDANKIQIGQVLELPDPEFYETLPAAGVTANKQDYSKTPVTKLPNTRDVDAEGNVIPGYADRVAAYAQALLDKKMTVNQVPEQYRAQAYKMMITAGTDSVAPYILNDVLLSPITIPSKINRAFWNEGRKLVARASGTPEEVIANDYGINDYFGDFSWTGKKFQSEHPIWAGVADVAADVATWGGLNRAAARAIDGAESHLGDRMMANMRATSKAMGMEEAAVPRAYEMVLPGRGSGVKYTATAKGAGKTGTVTRGARGGYSANSSAKGAYKNEASLSTKGKVEHVEPKAQVVPQDEFMGTGYTPFFYVPQAAPDKVSYVIVTPEETHIEERQPTLSRWVTTTQYNGPRVPYREGLEEAEYIEAQAPKGNSVKEQPITKESMQKKKGSTHRSAEEVSGPVVGSTPSGYFSGFGFTYGNEGGAWLRRRGGKLIPRNGN